LTLCYALGTMQTYNHRHQQFVLHHLLAQCHRMLINQVQSQSQLHSWDDPLEDSDSDSDQEDFDFQRFVEIEDEDDDFDRTVFLDEIYL